MKKVIFMLMILVMTFFVNITAFANETAKHAVSQNIINIGYIDGYGAIVDLDSVDEKGYLYDLFDRMADYCDYDFEFKQYADVAQLVKALELNEVQYIGPCMKTPEREERFLYSRELNNAVISLVVKSKSKKHPYGDSSWLNGKTVASYENSELEPYLDEYCEENNISVNYVRSSMETYINLDADVYLTSSMFNQFSEYYSVLNLSVYPLYVATLHENTELDKIVDDIYEETIASDADFIYELHEKYYGDSNSQRRYLTPKETGLLKDRTFKVAFESSQKFFSYVDENGKASGFLVNLFNQVAKKNGIENIEYIPYTMNGMGKNSVAYAVENADFVISFLGKYKDFKDDFKLSDSYMDIPLSLVVNDKIYYDKKHTDKRTIGLVRNMFLPPDSTNGILPNSEYKIYDESAQVMSDFESGAIDGFLLSECSLDVMKLAIKRSFHVMPTEAATPMKVWVSNELGNDYVKIINVIFDHLEYNVIAEFIAKEQEKYKITPTITEIIMENKGLFAAIFGFILLLIVIVFQQRKMRKKEQYLLEVDALTGLMTKYKFEQEAERILKNASPYEYLLICLDIDHFKHLNKIYGYRTGNAFLRAFSESLLECVPKGSIVSKLHEDNFILLLRYSESEQKNFEHELNAEDIKKYMVAIESSVKERYRNKLKSLGITTAVYFSVGVCFVKDPTMNFENLLECAKLAKKSEKNKFGTTVAFFTEKLEEKQAKERLILSTMEDAIAQEEFFIVVQPKVELYTGRIIGGEVLVRWQRKDGSFVYPDEFIPLFEKNDFIVKLDKYVLEKACEFISNAEGVMPTLSINLSVTTMLQTDFVNQYLDILHRYAVTPAQLELELTESVLDSNFEYISTMLAQLRQLGFSIAIDDFGKGASSLARIKEVQADVIKLDKDFLNDSLEDKKRITVLENVISMINSLGFITLAEGIETAEDLELLKNLGCNFGQGYLFARPLPTTEFWDKVCADAEMQYTEIITTDVTSKNKQEDTYN